MKIKFKLLLLFIICLNHIGCLNPKEEKKNEVDAVISEVEKDSVPPAFEEAKVPEFNPSDFEIIDGYIQINWQMLSRVIFEDKYINDTLAMVPIFHDDIKVLDGRPVQINGYNIPFGDDSGKLHILSAYPNSQCFFCGGAGPESVMDIKSKKVLKNLKTDARLTFRGTLELNDDNLDYLNYILHDAVQVK